MLFVEDANITVAEFAGSNIENIADILAFYNGQIEVFFLR